MKGKTNQADKFDSTYWWVIELDPNHPYNKVKVIWGYSKIVGHDEAKDKVMVLLKRIVMLFNNGYFERAISITFYMKIGDFVNKKRSRTLFTLKRKDYKIDTDCTSDQTFYNEFFIKRGVLSFLTRFYDCITNGKDVQFLLPRTKSGFSKDDYLLVEKQNFRSRKHLYAYAERMIKNGHPYDAVMNFQRKYEETKPFL